MTKTKLAAEKNILYYYCNNSQLIIKNILYVIKNRI